LKYLNILVIGGLTEAIAARRRGFSVDVIERDPKWAVYGVGILQQGKVIRAIERSRIGRRLLGGGVRLRSCRDLHPERAVGCQERTPLCWPRNLPALMAPRPPSALTERGDSSDALGRY